MDNKATIYKILALVLLGAENHLIHALHGTLIHPGISDEVNYCKLYSIIHGFIHHWNRQRDILRHQKLNMEIYSELKEQQGNCMFMT